MEIFALPCRRAITFSMCKTRCQTYPRTTATFHGYLESNGSRRYEYRHWVSLVSTAHALAPRSIRARRRDDLRVVLVFCRGNRVRRSDGLARGEPAAKKRRMQATRPPLQSTRLG